MPKLVVSLQKNIISAYGIHLLTSKNKIIKLLNGKYAPSVHGDKNWLSSFLLIDYLLHDKILEENINVLELGCGWGAVSIFCNAHNNCNVTGLDVDKNVFPFFSAQAELNNATVSTKKLRFENIKKAHLQDFDVLLGSDICFWDDLVPTLYSLIKRSLNAGVKEIVLADPGRSTFHELTEKCKSNQLNAECYEWYSLEPKHFEGYILHIRNK